MTALEVIETGPSRVELIFGEPSGPPPEFDESLLEALDREIQCISETEGLERVVFRSAHPAGFPSLSPGAVLPFETSDQAAEWSRRGQGVLSRLHRLPLLSVALIEGPCVGPGLELALACRVRVATDGEGIRLGLGGGSLPMPAWGGTVRLTRRVGPALAFELLRAGAAVPAAVARKWGLVDSLFQPGMAEATAATARPRAPRWPLTERVLNALPGGRNLIFRTLDARAAAHGPVAEALAAQVRRAACWPEEEALEQESRTFVGLFGRLD